MPTSLKPLREAIRAANSATELLSIETHVKVHTSFWGGQWISSTNDVGSTSYAGTASIDDFAQRMFELNIKPRGNEQSAEKKLQKSIIVLYKVSHRQIWNESLLITKIFYVLRQLTSALFGICFQGMRADTQDRWKEKYGIPWEGAWGKEMGDWTINEKYLFSEKPDPHAFIENKSLDNLSDETREQLRKYVNSFEDKLQAPASNG